MSRFLNDRYRSMKAYTPGAQPAVKNLIKLNTNESPFPPSPKVEAALRGASEGLNRYSDLSSAPLVNALCERDGVAPEQVITGNGSDEILAFAMLAFGGKGARFADITYGFYPVWAELFGIEKTIVPLDNNFAIRISDYLDAQSMIFIANPNAPTGIALPASEIEEMLVANPSCVVVVDEAYFGFGVETCAHLIDRYDNLLVVRTFSKSFALAGARVGYALGSAVLIEDMNKIRYSFHPYNLGTLPMLAAAAALHDGPYYERMRGRITNCREETARALDDMGFTMLPSSANFLFAKHEKMPGNLLQEQLEGRGIYIRRFDQPRIADYLRITIGTEAQMESLRDNIANILKGERYI